MLSMIHRCTIRRWRSARQNLVVIPSPVNEMAWLRPWGQRRFVGCSMGAVLGGESMFAKCTMGSEGIEFSGEGVNLLRTAFRKPCPAVR